MALPTEGEHLDLSFAISKEATVEMKRRLWQPRRSIIRASLLLSAMCLLQQCASVGGRGNMNPSDSDDSRGRSRARPSMTTAARLLASAIRTGHRAADTLVEAVAHVEHHDTFSTTPAINSQSNPSHSLSVASNLLQDFVVTTHVSRSVDTEQRKASSYYLDAHSPGMCHQFYCQFIAIPTGIICSHVTVYHSLFLGEPCILTWIRYSTIEHRATHNVSQHSH